MFFSFKIDDVCFSFKVLSGRLPPLVSLAPPLLSLCSERGKGEVGNERTQNTCLDCRVSFLKLVFFSKISQTFFFLKLVGESVSRQAVGTQSPTETTTRKRPNNFRAQDQVVRHRSSGPDAALSSRVPPPACHGRHQAAFSCSSLEARIATPYRRLPRRSPAPRHLYGRRRRRRWGHQRRLGAAPQEGHGQALPLPQAQVE